MIEKSRIALWDNLKFFLIFLVVLGHLTIYYFNSSQMFGTMTMVIYTFHMPAFVFVSGIFSRHSVSGNRFPLKRVVSFLTLYIITLSLNYGANIIFGKRISFSVLEVGGIAWYMIAMALWYIITYAVKNISPKIVFTIALIAACFIGYQRQNCDFLAIMRVVVFFPFFYAGFVIDRKRLEDVTSKVGARIFSAIFFTSFVLICALLFAKTEWLFPLLSGRRSYFDLEFAQDWGALLRLAYYVIVGLLIFSIVSLCPRKEFKISKFGSRTIQIYIIHRPVLYIMKNAGLFWLIKSVGPGWEWIAILLVIVLTFILCPKFMGKPFDIIMNPKERKYEKIS